MFISITKDQLYSGQSNVIKSSIINTSKIIAIDEFTDNNFMIYLSNNSTFKLKKEFGERLLKLLDTTKL